MLAPQRTWAVLRQPQTGPYASFCITCLFVTVHMYPVFMSVTRTYLSELGLKTTSDEGSASELQCPGTVDILSTPGLFYIYSSNPELGRVQQLGDEIPKSWPMNIAQTLLVLIINPGKNKQAITLGCIFAISKYLGTLGKSWPPSTVVLQQTYAASFYEATLDNRALWGSGNSSPSSHINLHGVVLCPGGPDRQCW